MIKLLQQMKRSVVAILHMLGLAWKASPILLISIFFLEILQGLVPVVLTWITKQIFDVLSFNAKNFLAELFMATLLPLLIVQTIMSVLMEVSGLIGKAANNNLGRKVMSITQDIIYGKITDLHGLTYFENAEFHDSLRLAVHGSQSGPILLLNIIIQVIKNVVTLIGLIGILLFINPIIVFLVIISGIPQFYLQIRINQQRYNLRFGNSPKERLSDYYKEVLSGIYFVKELRLLNLGSFFINRLAKLTREIHQADSRQELRELGTQLILNIFLKLVISLSFAFVLFQASVGQITLGDVALYLAALGTLQLSLISIFLATGSIHQATLFFQHYITLIQSPPSLYVPVCPRPVPNLRLGIELKGLSFRYSDQHEWLLRNINLTIPKGTCTALIGRNGCGKSTLVKLLTRMYDPCEGEILWDGINIREFDLTEYRMKIRTVFQDFVQFDLTVQENIGLGNIREIDDLVNIKKVAKMVGIDNDISHLPEGYSTLLSRWLIQGNSKRIELSGGQWQKIAAARMLTREGEFYVFDEPTSALDAEAEYEAYLNFSRIAKTKTTLLISHRFSTVRIAEFIAVIEKGEILEYGTHDELIAQAGTYAKFYKMQMEQYG